MKNSKEKIKEIYFLTQADFATTIDNFKNNTVAKHNKVTKMCMSSLVALSIGAMTLSTTLGAETFFTKAMNMIKELYVEIVGISTALAALIIAVACLVAFFSSSSRGTQTAVSWIKRVVLCWFAINLMGTIVTLAQKLTSGGGYTPVKQG